MKAARLAHQIVVQRATTTQDDYGEEVQTWADHATLMAEIRHGTGRERREAAAEQASIGATFLVRWTPLTEAITPEDRIVWSGNWDVTSNAPSLELNKHQEITAVRAA